LMAYLLYQKTKSTIVPYVMSSIFLVFYLTVLFAIHMNYTISSSLFSSLQLSVGAFLLLGAGFILRKMDAGITRAYFWIGHLYYTFAFLISLFYGKIAVWSTILAVLTYGISVFYARKEWKIKTFLYAGFTSLWIMITYIMIVLDMTKSLHYAWLATSIVLMIGWYISSKVWKRRITYYVLPFSFIGTMTFTSIHPFDVTMLVVTLLYIGIIIGLLHAVKWDVFNGLHFLLVFAAFHKFMDYHPGVEYPLVLMVAVIFVSIGVFLYPKLMEENKHSLPQFDWYTIAGFVALGFLYVYAGEMLWEKLLPGILVALAIYIQKDRIPAIKGKWITVLATGYLLEPYYTLLRNLELPKLFEREFYVFPWIALAIFIKSKAGNDYRKQLNYMQWAVLVIAAILLVQDGLMSNTVYDAIILGSLSLSSMLGGMFFKQKSFFVVGAGILLLNLLLQTKPFWGALPWWVYLLIAGSILIMVASYNEWHKQKTAEGKETLVTLFHRKIIQRIRNWE